MKYVPKRKLKKKIYKTSIDLKTYLLAVIIIILNDEGWDF